MSNFGIEIKSSDGAVIADSTGIFNVARLLSSVQCVQETTIGSSSANVTEVGVVQLNLGPMQTDFTVARGTTICLLASFSASFVNGDGLGTDIENIESCGGLVWPALTTEGLMPPEGCVPAIIMGNQNTTIDYVPVQSPVVFRFLDLPAGNYTAQVNMMTPPQLHAPPAPYRLSVGYANLQVLQFGY